MNMMTDALRLTREGRLMEATALLRGKTGPAPAATPATPGVAGRLAGLIGRITGRAAPLPADLAAPALRRGAPDVGMPASARFQSLTHTSEHGSRAYRLYVPNSDATRPRPLLVMLHGCTQTPEDFAAGTRMNALAEEHGVLVAWPAQPRHANPQGCWNWFAPDDQQRGAGEPAILAGIVEQIRKDHTVDPGRVFAAGLSAGGAAAAILGQAYPDVFAAVGVHSGLAAGAARDLGGALSAMRQGAAGAGGLPVPVIVFHGDQDRTVALANAAEVIAQAARVAPGLRRVREDGAAPGGRAFVRTDHVDAAGRVRLELWEVQGAGHAWSGGSTAGSFTDPAGPDASAEMLRFFLAQRRGP